MAAADAAARAADPAEDAHDLVAGRCRPADWDVAPGETDIHVFDTFAPALGEAFGRARSAGRILYGFVDHRRDHDVPRLLDRTAAASRAADRPLRLHRQDDGPRRAAPGSGGATRDFADVDALALEADARHAASAGRRARVDLPAGRYDTILPPTAVADLMIDAYWTAGARDAHDGQSVFSRRGGGTRIGERAGPARR